MENKLWIEFNGERCSVLYRLRVRHLHRWPLIFSACFAQRGKNFDIFLLKIYSVTWIYEHDRFQVLIRILALLPLNDGKNIRLVSRLWYDCCLIPSITKNEKFVFRSDFGVEDIPSILLKPDLLNLNLEFQGLTISSIPTSSWEARGPRASSLELYACNWDYETIKNILLHFSELKSFKIFNSYQERSLISDSLCPEILGILIRSGIKRSRLHTFTMMLNDEGYCFLKRANSLLSRIFVLYPCIEHFSYGYVSFMVPFSRDWYEEYGSKNQPIFSTLLHEYLNSFTQLRSLTVNLPHDWQWMNTCIKKHEQVLRSFIRDLHD